MKPTLSRIVHFVLPALAINPQRAAAEGPRPHRSAIITSEEGGDSPAMTVFLLAGDPSRIPGAQVRDGETARFPVGVVKHDETTKAPGTWHWPEREPISDDELAAQREVEKQKLRELGDEIREDIEREQAAKRVAEARAPATIAEPELVDHREAVEEREPEGGDDEKEAA